MLCKQKGGNSHDLSSRRRSHNAFSVGLEPDGAFGRFNRCSLFALRLRGAHTTRVITDTGITSAFTENQRTLKSLLSGAIIGYGEDYTEDGSRGAARASRT